MWMKLALGIYVVAGAIGIGLGATYFASKQFRSYHAEAVDTPWQEWEVGVQTLILALMTLAGRGWFALGFFTIVIALAALKTRSVVARWTLRAGLLIGESYGRLGSVSVNRCINALATIFSADWVSGARFRNGSALVLGQSGHQYCEELLIGDRENSWRIRLPATEQIMNILIYGAGNIGSLYAAKLNGAGHKVTILARGARLHAIRERGILLQEFRSRQESTTRIEAVERLAPEDAYDLVLVILPRDSVSEVLPVLAANRNSPSVMFFGNNAAGPEKMMESLGPKRVVLGFPGAAAVPHDEYIRYIILDQREQPTTIGELDGSNSNRIKSIATALQSAGFPCAICPNMDAWLKTHVAEISPTANALYMAGSELNALKRNRKALVLMFRAIREGHRVLTAQGIPITPSSHKIFRWMPVFILVAITRRKLSDKAWSIKIGHAVDARDEMRTIADEFRELARTSGIATPAIDQLRTYLDEINHHPAHTIETTI